MQLLTVVLAANTPVNFYKQGNFFRLHTAAYPVDVVLTGASQRYEYTGMEAGISDEPDGGFQRIELVSSLAQTIKIIVGQGSLSVDQITGSVQVINGELTRVLTGNAYMDFAQQAAVAGQLSHAQLWNPAGSGKNLILSKLSVLPTAVGSVAFGRTNVAHGTLIGNGSSKLLGGAAGTGQLRTTTSAASLLTIMGNFGIGVATTHAEFPLTEPVIIPPGWGFGFSFGVVNVQITATFQWFEQVI